MKTSLRFLAAVLISLAVAIPCFWQRRIQAGDLSSHVYNVWLVRESAARNLEGITVVTQSTNVLFDLILSAAVNSLGFDAGQKVSMAIVALMLFWGAFAFAWAGSGKRAWAVTPCLAILAYGWTFHMGFCNFNLSAGLCFLSLALAWKGGFMRAAWALLLLGLAVVAHPLPVGWAVCVYGYHLAAGRLNPSRMPMLLGAALLGIAGVHVLLRILLPTHWDSRQAIFITGADQAMLYGWKYVMVALGLFCLWGALVLERRGRAGAASLLGEARLHIVLLTAAAIVMMPQRIQFPQYDHALAFISPRLSLFVGIMLCAVLASWGIRRPVVAAFSGIALLFFSFLYVDSRALNRVESEMESLLDQLPRNARVVSALVDNSLRIDPFAHMIDRACVGRCYSYANYEPSTRQFRVRANARSGVVLHRYADCYAIIDGTYVVTEDDGVLHQIRACGTEQPSLCLRMLRPGDVTGKTEFRILPQVW